MTTNRGQRVTAPTAREAGAAVRAMLGVGELTACPGAFAFDQWSRADDGLTLGRIVSAGRDVRLSVVRPADLVGITVSEGTLTMHRDDEVAVLRPGDCGLLDQRRRTELRWTSVRAEFYCLPAATALRALQEVPSAQRLTPRSTDLGRFWHLLAQLIAGQVLNAPELRRSETIRSTMLDAFAAATVDAFGLTCAPSPEAAHHEEVIAEADSFLRAHLGDPVSIGDLARAVRLSPRGLQAAYQRAGAETPSGHLRRLRLETARVVLLKGDRSTTVSSAARRLGYSNVGRFSAQYREAYAESPAMTLRRAIARAR